MMYLSFSSADRILIEIIKADFFAYISTILPLFLSNGVPIVGTILTIFIV